MYDSGRRGKQERPWLLLAMAVTRYPSACSCLVCSDCGERLEELKGPEVNKAAERLGWTSCVNMADDVLFEFLHMEMVSHVYKEQASREDIDKDRITCVSILEGMGFRVGQGLIERCTKDYPTFKDDLDIMKFLCKDFWTSIFRKQVDNLRTNHQGTYVLQDNKFTLLTQVSSGKQHLEDAPKYLAYSCGLIRGALSNLGLESVVTAEVSLMPSCKFQVVIQKI
ncbi:hypothetical protein AOLI_G00323120 [Acnodon oligacanthus]